MTYKQQETRQTTGRESTNTLEGKSGLLLNRGKAELFSASFHSSYIVPDTQGIFHLMRRMCKRRLDGVRGEQSKHISKPGCFKSAGTTGNVPTVLGELPAIISKPLTITLQVPERPGEV